MEIYTFSNNLRVRAADLLQIQINRYQETGNPNLHEPVEEGWILKLFEEGFDEGACFLDVGAAIGYYSVLLKKTWPALQVYAVEPLPRFVSALRATMALNDLAGDDITIIQAAVAPLNGDVLFQNLNYGSRLLPHPIGETSVVKAKRLAALIEDLPPIHCMKMDIQGPELMVLSDGSAILSEHHIRHVVVGTHERDIHDGVVELLRRCGYVIRCDDPTPPMQPDGLVVASVETPALSK